MSDDATGANRSDAEGSPPAEPPIDPAAELRAQIAATRANLAAAADALAARMATPPPPAGPATPAPRTDTLTAGASNLPVLYRPHDTRRALTIAGAVLGAVLLAYRLSRRFRH